MDFPFSCTIAPASSNDGYGLTYGTAVPSECNYFESEDVDEEGSNSIISAWLALPPGTSISSNSRVTLSDGTQPPIVKIRTIRRPSDPDEVEYTRVILGDSNERGGV